MAVDRYRITYSDGTVEEVVRLPIHQVRAEAVTGVSAATGGYTYVFASLWAAATGGKGNAKAFESWLERLVEFEPIVDEGDDADPPGHGATSSPD